MPKFNFLILKFKNSLNVGEKNEKFPMSHYFFLYVSVNGIDILVDSQNSAGCSDSKKILALIYLAIEHIPLSY